jgi:hypothetical protein
MVGDSGLVVAFLLVVPVCSGGGLFFGDFVLFLFGDDDGDRL